MLNPTRPLLRMLAFGCERFTSSGVRHCAWAAMVSHTSNCERAALIALYPAWAPREVAPPSEKARAAPLALLFRRGGGKSPPPPPRAKKKKKKKPGGGGGDFSWAAH